MATVTTLPSSNQSGPSRPAECPACKHCGKDEEEGCGMLTFSASQLGAVAALIIGGLFYLGQLGLRWQQMKLSASTQLGATAAEREMFFSLQFWTILFMTALYYAVGEWAAEEHDYHELRKIKWPSVEFWWRVGLAASFGVAAAGAPLTFGLSRPAHSSAIFLVGIYAGFLAWDIIVFEGGKKNISWRLIVGDFCGALLTLTCLWSHYQWPIVGVFAVFGAFGLSLIFLYQSLQNVNFSKRILDRPNSLR